MKRNDVFKSDHFAHMMLIIGLIVNQSVLNYWILSYPLTNYNSGKLVQSREMMNILYPAAQFPSSGGPGPLSDHFIGCIENQCHRCSLCARSAQSEPECEEIPPIPKMMLAQQSFSFSSQCHEANTDRLAIICICNVNA